MAETIQRGKIKKAPAAEIVQYLIRPAIEGDLKRSYNTILDINKAHILMLAKTGIIRKEVAKQLLQATAQIESEKDHPTFDINPNVEDLYFNLERYLIKLTGLEVGGQQHTARSRNDLFATEIRIDTRKSYLKLAQLFIELRRTYLDLARRNLETVMSGYTHMQPSEPITFAHYLSGVSYALARDYERYSHAWKSLNLCPLGGCSMGSTSFPIDRDMTAKLLGFDAPVQNSLDCVASRDYLLEILMALSATAVTMSRTALDFYNWSTPQYGYIEVDDSCAVCSSIMPQKKNPDIAELARGKSGRLIGDLAGLLTTLKGLPTAYARDLQEDKEAVFDQVDTLEVLLPAFTGMVGTMVFNKERLEAEAPTGFALATDIAEWLVKNGVPFRHAHELSGACVKIAEDRGQELWDLADDDFIEVFKEFLPADKAPEVREVLSTEGSVSARNGKGGTSPLRVREQIVSAKTAIEQLRAFANSVSDGPAYKTPESLLK